MPSWTTPPTWTSGQVVTTTEMTTLSSDLSYLSQPPIARFHGTSAQVIPTNTWTQVTGTTVDFASGITTSTANEFIIVTAGKYIVSAKTQYGGPTSGGPFEFAVAAYLNGAATANQFALIDSPGFGTANITDLLSCAIGDVLQLWTFQNYTTGYGLDSNPTANTFSATWVSF